MGQATATVTFRPAGKAWAKRTFKLTTQQTQTWTKVKVAVTACTARTLTKAKLSNKILGTWRMFNYSRLQIANLSLSQFSKLLTAGLKMRVTQKTLIGRFS